MAVAQGIVVLLHLIGFAALLGGALVQLRDRAPEINTAMLVGAWIALLTGAGLIVFAVTGPGPVHYPQLIVKSVIALFAVVLVAKNRKFADIPRGLLLLIVGLATAEAALPIFWQ